MKPRPLAWHLRRAPVIWPSLSFPIHLQLLRSGTLLSLDLLWKRRTRHPAIWLLFLVTSASSARALSSRPPQIPPPPAWGSQRGQPARFLLEPAFCDVLRVGVKTKMRPCGLRTRGLDSEFRAPGSFLTICDLGEPAHELCEISIPHL